MICELTWAALLQCSLYNIASYVDFDVVSNQLGSTLAFSVFELSVYVCLLYKIYEVSSTVVINLV